VLIGKAPAALASIHNGVQLEVLSVVRVALAGSLADVDSFGFAYDLWLSTGTRPSPKAQERLRRAALCSAASGVPVAVLVSVRAVAEAVKGAKTLRLPAMADRPLVTCRQPGRPVCPAYAGSVAIPGSATTHWMDLTSALY